MKQMLHSTHNMKKIFLISLLLQTTLSFAQTLLFKNLTITNISEQGATVSSGLEYNGIHYNITECGFYYDTDDSFDDSKKVKSTSSSFLKFEEKICPLESNTKYIIRAYVVIDGKTFYSKQKQFYTKKRKKYIYPDEAIKSYFSVSNNKKICFSRGSLQYHTGFKIWRFAKEQYETVGEFNRNYYFIKKMNGLTNLSIMIFPLLAVMQIIKVLFRY